MSNQYYTLEEVQKLLKKSRSTVLRDAKAGLIPFEVEEGKTKGRRYPKTAIDAIVEIQQEKTKDKNVPRLVFSSSTSNDLWSEVTIGRELYGEDDIAIRHRPSFRLGKVDIHTKYMRRVHRADGYEYEKGAVALHLHI